MPSDDVEALAAALHEALHRPEEARRRAQAARELALARYTSDTMARGFEQVYADVLRRPVGRAHPSGV